jgi:hypothetical protein
MSIKRILVPLPGSVDQTGEIDMALSAAKALGLASRLCSSVRRRHR